MNIERFCLKFFAQPKVELDEALFIDIFQEWIRERRLAGILLDVVDYRHVPHGPGIILITHDINFSMDYTAGQFGLLAQRKSGPGRTHQDRLLALVQATLSFGALLEADPRVAGRLQFKAGTFHYLANDRLLAPNTQVAFSSLKPDLKEAAKLIYPGQPVLITKLVNDPRERLTAVVETGQWTMKDLVDRMGAIRR